MEKTFGMIKPHAVRQKQHFKILDMIEEKAGNIIFLKYTVLSSNFVEKFYFHHMDKAFFSSMIREMTSGPVIAFVVAGDNVVQKYRDLCGATNPLEASEGTIRKKFGVNLDYNAVHASDGVQNAITEIKMFNDFVMCCEDLFECVEIFCNQKSSSGCASSKCQKPCGK